MSETTPFLADNDHVVDQEAQETHVHQTFPANSFFTRPLKLLTAVNCFLSVSILGLLIATCILINIGPFNWTYGAADACRDLGIVLLVNALVSSPAFLIELPILINICIHITMSIVVFVFSALVFAHWPDDNFCRRYTSYPDFKPLPETWECQQARNKIRIQMGVSGGVGILIGIVILYTLLLRVIALFKSKFWRSKAASKFTGFRWNPTGFTVQLTLSILRQEPADGGDRNRAKTIDTSSRNEEGRLIET